jgi:hypothetical protein
MRIGISGATGLIGSAVVSHLTAAGHELKIFGRRPVPGLQFSPWDVLQPLAEASALSGLDAFIHLAGTPIADGRWTDRRKESIRATRVEGTGHLVEAFRRSPQPPPVLLAASAVGFYGDRGHEILDEDSPPGKGFLPDLCRQWEDKALEASSLGVRVVLLRTGIVLSPEGGALAKMLPPFRLGLAGPLGSGRQYLSWIHLRDHVRLLELALYHRDAEGPLNCTAPRPVTNQEFTRTLAAVLHRPAWFPVPGWGLRLLFGEMAQALLEGQRVVPRRALELGFAFKFGELADALRDLLGVRQAAAGRHP